MVKIYAIYICIYMLEMLYKIMNNKNRKVRKRYYRSIET